MTTPPPETVALHGWTAVPLDPEIILEGKPYLNEPNSLLVKNISFPSSDPLVARVQAYAKEKLPRQTYNHSMRVYYWASTILHQQFPTHAASLSPSTLALVCLLHDIGTAPSFLPTTQLSFEFHGALIARDVLLNCHHPTVPSQTGDIPVATQSQAEAIIETIIRHQDLGTVGTISFLGQLIQLATVYDNVGRHPDLVHADTRLDVNRAFPRGGWSGCFARTLREELARKPWAHSTHLGGSDFPAGVERNQLMAEYDSWE